MPNYVYFDIHNLIAGSIFVSYLHTSIMSEVMTRFIFIPRGLIIRRLLLVIHFNTSILL